jgi:hypothetical protein
MCIRAPYTFSAGRWFPKPFNLSYMKIIETSEKARLGCLQKEVARWQRLVCGGSMHVKRPKRSYLAAMK